MFDFRRLLKSAIFWQSMANYAERFWSLILSVIFARLILPEIFGEVAYGVAIAQVFAILFRWEIGNLVRADPFYQKDGFAVIWRITEVLVILEILLILIISSVCFYISISKVTCLVVLISGVITALDKFSMVLRSDLEGDGQFKPNFVVVISRVPACILIAIPLAFLGYGVGALVTPLVITVVVNWVTYSHFNKRKIATEFVNRVQIQRALKPGFWNWLNNLCHTLMFRGDKLLLGSLGSSENLGYYNRAFNFSPLSFMLLGAFSMGPAITQVRNMKSFREKLHFFWKRGLLLTLPGVVVGCIWLFWADKIVLFVFGENWVNSIPYFKAFAFLGVIQSIYYLANALLQGSRLYRLQSLLKVGVVTVAIIFSICISLDGILIVYLLQGCMLLMTTLIIISLAYMVKFEKSFS